MGFAGISPASGVSPSTSCPFHLHFSSFFFFFLVIILKGNEQSFPSLGAAKSCGPYLNPVALTSQSEIFSPRFYFILCITYLAALGLICGTWDLPCGMRDLFCILWA